MNSSHPQSRRGKSRPRRRSNQPGRKQRPHQPGRRQRPNQPGRRQRPNQPARRVASPDEEKFLAGTAVNPHQRIVLEKGSDNPSVRALDLVCPIGMGQRALVVSSAGLGKTTLLKHICQSVETGYPDMKVYCVLVDERPEEVTDFKRSVKSQVYASSIDHGYEDHIRTVGTVTTEAFREAAAGNNVMILVDSLTRLARAHNLQSRGGGRTLSGGVDAGALEVPRRIFGAARDVEDLGSITIVATILVDTGSVMDSVIFEEFKGTGNLELVLSKDLARNRVFPAFDVSRSGTRRAELLYEPKEFSCLELLYRGMASTDNLTAMTKLLELIHKYPTNSELLKSFGDV